MRYLILLPLLFLVGCQSVPEPAPEFPVALVNAKPLTVPVNEAMPEDLFAEGMSEADMIEGIEALYGYAAAQRLRADVFQADSVDLRKKMLEARKWILLNQN